MGKTLNTKLLCAHKNANTHTHTQNEKATERQIQILDFVKYRPDSFQIKYS